MQIHREKFLALTATLAGFWPNAACVIDLGGLTTSATLDLTTTTSGETTGGTAGSTSGESSGGASQGATEAPTSEGGTDPTTTTTTTPTTGGTTGTVDGDCCVAHMSPGCNDDVIEACVCAMDMFCCGLEDGTWDETCVAEVAQFGCGMCDVDTGTGTDGTGGSTGGSTGDGSGSSG